MLMTAEEKKFGSRGQYKCIPLCVSRQDSGFLYRLQVFWFMEKDQDISREWCTQTAPEEGASEEFNSTKRLKSLCVHFTNRHISNRQILHNTYLSAVI